jgi:hypothetical protein
MRERNETISPLRRACLKLCAWANCPQTLELYPRGEALRRLCCILLPANRNAPPNPCSRAAGLGSSL